MKLIDRLERTERGSILNLARDISGDNSDFVRTFNLQGCSGKDAYQAKCYGAGFLRTNAVVEIDLPYVAESQYFADLLQMMADEDDEAAFSCKVVLRIPPGVDLASLDRHLLDQFKAIRHVTCEVCQVVISYISISEDELGSAPEATFGLK